MLWIISPDCESISPSSSPASMMDWISFSRCDESLAEKIPLSLDVIVFFKIGGSS